MSTPPLSERRVPGQVVLVGAATRDEIEMIAAAFPGTEIVHREWAIEGLAAICVLWRTDRERRCWGLPAERRIALVLAESMHGDGDLPSLLGAIERRFGGVELWRNDGEAVAPVGAPSPAGPRPPERRGARGETGVSPSVTPEEIRMLLADSDEDGDAGGRSSDAPNEPEARA
jgi:hypothetical protein